MHTFHPKITLKYDNQPRIITKMKNKTSPQTKLNVNQQYNKNGTIQQSTNARTGKFASLIYGTCRRRM